MVALVGEDVAGAALVDYHARRVITQLGAQPLDIYPDMLGDVLGFRVPYFFGDEFVGDDLALVADEQH